MSDTHFLFLEQLRALANAERAAGMASYHKVKREYLGLTNPQVNDLTKEWRKEMTVDERVEVADGLWQTDIFEARLAATKLLTQARIRPDDAVWDLLQSWVPDFDSWALADHACSAIQKRLVADPTRLDAVETWTTSENLWTRRAALVATLPWTKQNNPKQEELECRERILRWAATYAQDQKWFIQKSVAWWLRDLSKHDAQRVHDFLAVNGEHLKNFARKEALKYLK
ncbi:DNA alkylation repair protein [Sedimentitalea sp. CY04]|uniref:DNA alkylation repair protein n=1 Tax=Parasedimentitalea denitrificans TaxID=2211118 RepID=A0ABX0W1G2_9RHOB|nr:DNA alkylation repair protein [Sedimentitalea sp. CY04]NIZ59483.1 DNA alkylation repair protein [Sedimentitalea sp. CY04]